MFSLQGNISINAFIVAMLLTDPNSISIFSQFSLKPRVLPKKGINVKDQLQVSKPGWIWVHNKNWLRSSSSIFIQVLFRKTDTAVKNIYWAAINYVFQKSRHQINHIKIIHL